MIALEVNPTNIKIIRAALRRLTQGDLESIHESNYGKPKHESNYGKPKIDNSLTMERFITVAQTWKDLESLQTTIELLGKQLQCW